MSKANRLRFRGKLTDGGEWVCGTGLTDFLNIYPTKTGHMWIWSTDYFWLEVDPKTVGQSTGLTDKHGKEIFERDMLEFNMHKDGVLKGAVEQCHGGAWFINHNRASFKYVHQIHCEVCDTGSPRFLLSEIEAYELTIIGNIHENPELLDSEETGAGR